MSRPVKYKHKSKENKCSGCKDLKKPSFLKSVKQRKEIEKIVIDPFNAVYICEECADLNRPKTITEFGVIWKSKALNISAKYCNFQEQHSDLQNGTRRFQFDCPIKKPPNYEQPETVDIPAIDQDIFMCIKASRLAILNLSSNALIEEHNNSSITPRPRSKLKSSVRSQENHALGYGYYREPYSSFLRERFIPKVESKCPVHRFITQENLDYPSEHTIANAHNISKSIGTKNEKKIPFINLRDCTDSNFNDSNFPTFEGMLKIVNC